MANFFFYIGSDLAVVDRLRSTTAAHWGAVKEVASDPFHFFVAEDDVTRALCESANAVGAISGYARCDQVDAALPGDAGIEQRHHRRFIETVVTEGNWPLGEDWTGSFAAVAYARAAGLVSLCNDPIGYIPLYYSRQDDGLIGGTSLIVLSHSVAREVDTVGVLQQITSPFCNYGRRTVLKQVERLLPGEWLSFSPHDRSIRRAFDNTLCDRQIDGNVDKVARTVWDCLQREVALAVGDEQHIHVALSGGWDSRLVLQAARQLGRPIECYTYGGDDLHETVVARRCAAAVGARHRAFAIVGNYFPPRHRFEPLVRQTEAANIPEWYPVLAGLEGEVQGRPLLLLGDHCESIDGRNMTGLSSRKARRSAFLRGLLGRSQVIPSATSARYDAWRDRMQQQVIRDVVASLAQLSPALKKDCSEEKVAGETAADLELGFQRVRDQNVPFAPMFEELFWWFHGIRYIRAGQNVMLSSLFCPISPVMSLRALRLISSVHPRLRIRRRLMDAIARLPEFDALARVPSAQIPWVGARAPALLREVIWGVRSGLDQWLIGRVMAKKDPTGRQRVLPTTDLLAEYRRDHVVPTVRDWFSGRWLDGAHYVGVVTARARMEAWPLINADIAAPANTSILLDLCRFCPSEDGERER